MLLLLERRPREALLLLLPLLLLPLLLLLRLLRLLVKGPRRPVLPKVLSLLPKALRRRMLLLLLLPGEQRRRDVGRQRPLLITLLLLLELGPRAPLLLLLKLLLRAKLRTKLLLLLLIHHRHLPPSDSSDSDFSDSASAVPEGRQRLPLLPERRHGRPAAVEQPAVQPRRRPRRGLRVGEAQQSSPFRASRGRICVEEGGTHQRPKLPRRSFHLRVRGPPVERTEEDGGPRERGWGQRWRRGPRRA